jgi:hypothetical protein
LHISKLSRHEAVGYAAAITVFVVSLLIKTRELAFNPSLWGEDTKVFIYDALHHGTVSVFMPANGSGYLIQRLVALSVVFLPLRYAEIIFHLFTFAAACFTAAIVWRFAPIRSIMGRLLACAALPFLPTNSLEIWFALVNVHWYLGIALALILTNPITTASRPSWLLLAAVFLMCLSGPFSILMAPAVLARALVLKDWRRGWPLYLVYGSATIIQATIVALTAPARFNVAPNDSLRDWLHGILGNALMGFFTTPTLFIIGSVIILASIFLAWPRIDRASRFQVAAILFIAVVHIAAAYYSHREYPELIAPYKLHARYFIIPYGLGIIFVLSLGIGWTRYATMALVIAICVVGFRPFHHLDIATPELDRSAGSGRSPTYLASYIDLAHHLGVVNFYGRPGTPDFELTLQDSSPEPATVDNPLNYEDIQSDFIPVPATCATLDTVAIAFDANIEEPGVFVFNSSRRTDPAVFPLWFQQFHHVAAGLDHETFAVPNNGVRAIRLTTPPETDVKNARLICF